ncbi:MAG: two-component system response regulator BaeR [Gammaproteobacteria bacterium]|nr:two-component system response regulator BaeR [Gammaproteobacteria bacterium]HBF09505.1 two-component system response regulator BaeR [Gammaproteobacteria bacterium]|tara:strand:- start:17762 stop:18445 length:684 start_codon:yes stop_codon:yes gene_type:complete
MSTKTILIIEDEFDIAHLIERYLELENYKSVLIDHGRNVLQVLQTHQPDLIILDVMLPDVDGFDLCRQIRQVSQTPVILLTAKIDEVDRLIGFDAGADDYVCKPFSPKELMCRIHVLLKRSKSSLHQTTSLTYKEFTLEVASYLLKAHGKETMLTLNEYRILSLLMSSPGIVFSRHDLLEGISDAHAMVYDRTIDTHIKNIRAKFALLSPSTQYIKSVYGVGYVLKG